METSSTQVPVVLIEPGWERAYEPDFSGPPSPQRSSQPGTPFMLQVCFHVRALLEDSKISSVSIW